MAQTRVSKSQFQAKALEYLRDVEATSKTAVVTDNRRPTVEIRRLRTDRRRPLGRLRGSVVEYHGPFEPVAEYNWKTMT